MSPIFCKAKKGYIDKEAWESMKQKLLEMFQVTVLFYTDEFIFVWSFKNRKATNSGSNHKLEKNVPILFLLCIYPIYTNI